MPKEVGKTGNVEEAPKGKATLLTDQLPETAERFTFSVNGDNFFFYFLIFTSEGFLSFLAKTINSLYLFIFFL